MKNVKSLYIHIPFCLSKCKYCDFFSIANKKINSLFLERYVNALCNELNFRLSKNKLVQNGTIYIGGGTPSLLSEQQLSKILNTVNKFIHISKLSEITIEVNPDDVTEEYLKALSDLGFSRISMGLQSMNNEVLKFAGRRADRNINLNALSLIKKNWKGELSVDLISGLPQETLGSFEEGICKVIEYEPDHISVYSLTIEDETPFGQLYNNEKLKYDWDFADSMWLKARKILYKAGYNQYEVSNFSKPGKECKHNITYWSHENYIGAGSGGTGTVYPFRWTNNITIDEYINYWEKLDLERRPPQNEEEIDEKTEKLEFFMMGLRKLSGIKSSEYKQYFNEDFPQIILNKFMDWQKKNLLIITKEMEDTVVKMTSEGILFLNKILEEIFICLE